MKAKKIENLSKKQQNRQAGEHVLFVPTDNLYSSKLSFLWSFTSDFVGYADYDEKKHSAHQGGLRSQHMTDSPDRDGNDEEG